MDRRQTTFLLYLRQSVTRDDPADSLSLSFQERALREMVARENGVVLEPPIIDADQRGWDPERPGLKQMFARIESQHPDAIGVYAMSRFARDSWLQEGLWRKAKSVQPDLIFRSVTEPHAHDDMVRGILGVISQAERKRMGAFLRSSFQERARRGKPHGRVPFGFEKDDDGRLVVIPDQRDLILQVIERFEAEWSLRRIAYWMQEQADWDRRWEPNTIRNIIVSPAIAGAIKCGDVIEWDCHEPIITRERHEQLVAKYESRRYVRTKRVSSWLERLIICGCGTRLDLAGSTHQPQSSWQFKCAAYYHHELPNRPNPYPACMSSPRSITLPKAERLTIEALRRDLESLPAWQEVYDRTAQSFQRRQPDFLAKRRKLERDIAGLERERDRLLVLYRRATLDVDRWEKEDSAISGRVELARSELASMPDMPSEDQFRQRAAQLRDLGDQFRLITSVAPEEIAKLMRSAGVVAQLDRGSVRLQWPHDLSPFFAF